jgi:hypothetical protein
LFIARLERQKKPKRKNNIIGLFHVIVYLCSLKRDIGPYQTFLENCYPGFLEGGDRVSSFQVAVLILSMEFPTLLSLKTRLKTRLKEWLVV